MKQVLLRVGFCLLVAPNAGSPFLGHFKAMCTALNLPCQRALRGNQALLQRPRFNTPGIPRWQPGTTTTLALGMLTIQ
eukprot:scaffold2709_cov163-Amphora_coffeaeformis.AAC.2